MPKLSTFTVIGVHTHDDGGRFAEDFEAENAADAERQARSWSAASRDPIFEDVREVYEDEVVIAAVIIGDFTVVA